MSAFSRDELRAAPAGFVQEREVRFQDVDAAGIAFFPRILEYLHDAYLAFIDRSGCSLVEVLATRAWAAPLKHAEADFLRPLRFGDRLEVALCRARFDGSVLTIGYRIIALPSREAAAVGNTVHVFVDAATFQRIAPPPLLVEAFARIG
jgi:1,4-dihydroxy-2-naphthoyl-CoA hydrolase